MTSGERLAALVKAAVELTTQETPDWEFIAARLLNFRLTKNSNSVKLMPEINMKMEITYSI